jgi:hypothetical protein
MMRRLREEEGSTLPLVAGFGALALALVLVAAAASSLYLERKQLFTLADGAALVGAEAFDLDDVVVTDGTPGVVLEPADVHRDVAAFLASTPNGGFEGLVLEEATTRDGIRHPLGRVAPTARDGVLSRGPAHRDHRHCPRRLRVGPCADVRFSGALMTFSGDCGQSAWNCSDVAGSSNEISGETHIGPQTCATRSGRRPGCGCAPRRGRFRRRRARTGGCAPGRRGGGVARAGCERRGSCRGR